MNTDEQLITAEPYPLDFDEIHKGTTIPVEEVERIYRISRHDVCYSLKAMGLAKRIEEELTSRGTPVTACVIKGAVRVLTDPEASRYNYDMAQRRFGGMVHSHKRLIAVDTGEFDTDLNTAHTRRHVVLGGMISGAIRGKKEARQGLTEHKRSVPGLPSQDTDALVKKRGVLALLDNKEDES